MFDGCGFDEILLVVLGVFLFGCLMLDFERVVCMFVGFVGFVVGFSWLLVFWIGIWFVVFVFDLKLVWFNGLFGCFVVLCVCACCFVWFCGFLVGWVVYVTLTFVLFCLLMLVVILCVLVTLEFRLDRFGWYCGLLCF